MKCNDCGTDNYTPSRRGDVCEDCMNLRGQLITAVSEKRVDMDEFREIQRTLAGRSGQGANAIRRVLGIGGFVIALLLVVQLAFSGDGPQRRIPIHGTWDAENPDQFRTTVELDRSRSYTIANDTDDTIYVFLVEVENGGRTPRDYFPVLAGQTQLFGAPGHMLPDSESFSFDLILRDHEGDKVRGIELREAGPEIATD
jgi:hypothetical protein